MNKKLQLNSKFEFNNNFFFISPLLHEYSFFDPRSGPGIWATVNIPKAAAHRRVGKVEKPLAKKKKLKKNENQKKRSPGAVRESNPRPLPPEGRIIPLDQRP